MKVLLIGGYNSINASIVRKLGKERVRVYVLNSNRQTAGKFKDAYEQYNFSYENPCVKEVFESVAPDIVLFSGAFDSNFDWDNGYREAVSYGAGLYNVLNAFALLNSGRFIYLSSYEAGQVSNDEYKDTTKDMDQFNSDDLMQYSKVHRAKAIQNGEQICESFRKTFNVRTMVIRINELCTSFDNNIDMYDECVRMVVEALKTNTITIRSRHYSPLNLSDAVEFLYRTFIKESFKHSMYFMGSDSSIDGEQLADLIDKKLNMETLKVLEYQEDKKMSFGLNDEIFDIRKEIDGKVFNDAKMCAEKVIDNVIANKAVVLESENQKNKKNLSQRIWLYLSNIFHALLPFIENMVVFIPFFMINNRVTDSQYFAKLDCYLLYVLFFAIFYGQQQAAFSAILSVGGYIFRQTYERTGFDVAMDYNTYVWIAQLMILGLSVGYLRDKLTSTKADNSDEIIYLESRLKDIEDINSVNVKLKNNMETQIVNQTDSLGKIYDITSSLDSDEPEEVFFHAAELVSQLMDCKSVAIYNVSNNSYARLMSSTSALAKKLGNSIEYVKYGKMYDELANGNVYINKTLNKDYPLMAVAIIVDDKMQSIIMLWDISFEKMNLSYSNRLKVISFLIQNAVLRANKYIKVLESERYIEDSKVLDAQAFRKLIDAFLNARRKNLAECAIIRISCMKNHTVTQTGSVLEKLFRASDYMGSLNDGYLYVILSNTSNADASYVTKRIEDAGYKYQLLNEI